VSFPLLFNSYIFILLFLPLCLVGYFVLNHFRQYKLALVFLLGMSLWFYGYFTPSYLLIILTSVIANYSFTQLMERTHNPKLRKLEIILAVGFNLGVLFYFKYYDFFIENLNRVFQTEFTLKHILLPLGISFFTFQQISYVVDFYRGEVEHNGFLQYACFVTYFPQLVAGPIVTHDELIPQLMDENRKTFNWENFCKGMFLFTMGLAKKVLIADVFGGAVNWGFANVLDLDTTNAFLAALGYSIQIYFDFSGYGDLAIGIGLMMNIDLPVNFDSPYKALTILEFWKRWHKTLTRFFTKYLYYPLGGSRKGRARTYLNTMIIYTASGLWHGAAYTYIIWGMLHGAFNVIARHFKSWFDKLHPVVNWFIFFGFMVMSSSLFRSNSVTDFLNLCENLMLMNFGPVNENIMNAFLIPEIQFLIRNVPALDILKWHPEMLLTLFYGGAMFLILGVRNAYEHMQTFRPTVWNMLGIGTLLVVCVLSFSGVSTFLYFNF